MNRLFDQASGDSDRSLNGRTWAPPVEIYETGEELVILAELPGLARKEIDISLDGGQLTLSGERHAPEEDGRNYHRSERFYGRFERSFQLAASYDSGKIQADLRNGILTVRLPKKEEAKPRRISISVG